MLKGATVLHSLSISWITFFVAFVIKFRELIWLCQWKKARSNQASISVNSCGIEKLFPMINVKENLFFLFMLCFGIMIFRLVGKNCCEKWKIDCISLIMIRWSEPCFVFSDLKSSYNFSKSQYSFFCWKLLFAVGGFLRFWS